MKDLSGLRIAAYARYSSEMQDEGSIDAQFLLLSKYVEGNGGKWDEVTTFSDAAESGASMDRPGVQQLLKRIQNKNPAFDVIVVESIDRLSRTVSDTARLCDELDFADVRLIAVSEGIDTADPNARLLLDIKSSLAQQFLKELSGKTRRGLHGRAAKGFCTGGLAYGYTSVQQVDSRGKSTGSTIEIVEDDAKVIKRIYDLWIAGNSNLAIAKRLNEDGVPTPRTSKSKRGWSDGTVRAILRNPAYVGKWQFGLKRWVKVPGTKKRRYKDAPQDQLQVFDRPHLRILDDATWKAAQERIEAVAGKFRGRKGAAPLTRTSYPLSGILFCGQCQGPMSIIGGSSAKYYRCIDSRKRGTCPRCQPLRDDQITPAVLGLVKTRLSTPATYLYLEEMLRRRLASVGSRREEEAKPLRKALNEAERKVNNLVASLASGELAGASLAPVQRALEAAESQRAQLEARLQTLQAETPVPTGLTAQDISKRARTLIENLEGLLKKNPTEARETLRKFFFDGKIYLHPTKDGGWRAETRFFPNVILNKPTKHEGPGGESKAFVDSYGCAGRI